MLLLRIRTCPLQAAEDMVMSFMSGPAGGRARLQLQHHSAVRHPVALARTTQATISPHRDWGLRPAGRDWRRLKTGVLATLARTGRDWRLESGPKLGSWDLGPEPKGRLARNEDWNLMPNGQK